MGREFFCCPAPPEAGCRMFQWVGARIPASLNSGSGISRKEPAKVVSSTSSKTFGTFEVTFKLHKISESPHIRIWLSIFHVYSSQYTHMISALLQSFPATMRHFDSSLKFWTIDFQLYEPIICQLQSQKFDFVKLKELPVYLLKILKNFLAFSSVDATVDKSEPQIPPFLLGHLKPFQIEAVKYTIRHNGRVLIGDEMG
jgi:hypothetical protein